MEEAGQHQIPDRSMVPIGPAASGLSIDVHWLDVCRLLYNQASADTDGIGGIAAVRVGLPVSRAQHGRAAGRAPTLVDREGRPYHSRTCLLILH